MMKKRIRWCHTHHKQVLGILNTEYRGVIEPIESKSEVLGLTICQLILQWKSAYGHHLVVSVDWKLYSLGEKFTFPKMYESEVHDYMLSTRSHLFKKWKRPVLQFFTLDEQLIIHNKKWGNSSNTILAIELMLDTLVDKTKEV